MIECESIARKWGSSLGLTIPKEIVERTFGTLRNWKTPTDKIMKELRKGSWDE